VGQGLPAPRGAKAWTELGLQGIGQHAKPLADCAADELWRGLLGLSLTEDRQARELLDQAEAKLDALAPADRGGRLLESIPGVGPRNRSWPSWAPPGASTAAGRCRPTAGWCRASTSPANRTAAAASPAAARRCCASCWWSAPGSCCGTTVGRGRCTSG